MIFILMTSGMCSDDPKEDIDKFDPIIGQWHGWMDSYKNDQVKQRELHNRKVGEMGYITFKDGGTCEMVWYDDDDFDPSFYGKYQWTKDSNNEKKYLLTFIEGHDESGNEDDEFAGNCEIILIDNSTIDVGFWAGEKDESHEQLKKGSFKLSDYRDMDKKDLVKTKWNGEIAGMGCEIKFSSGADLYLYEGNNAYPSYNVYYDYKKNGDIFVLTKSTDYSFGTLPSGFNNIEMRYISSVKIQLRRKGDSVWSDFSKGSYTPATPPVPSVDLAQFLKGTSWEAIDTPIYDMVSITFDSGGKKGVFISAFEDEDGYTPENGGAFTYTVGSTNDYITIKYDGEEYEMGILVLNDHQIEIEDNDAILDDCTLSKENDALKSSDIVGTWKYSEDDELYTINLASGGSGYLKWSYDGDSEKEKIYWHLSGSHILLLDEDKEPYYILTVTDHGSRYLTMYYEEIGEVVKFTK